MSEKKIVITGKSKNIKFDDFDSQIQIDELKYDAMDIEDALYEYGDIE